MAFQLIGKKKGMTQIFDSAGNLVVCTVIHVEPNVITQIKNKESDGYLALQLAANEIKVNDPRTLDRRQSKAMLGHFKKAGVAARRNVAEARVDSVDSFTLGQEVGLSLFEKVTHVDVTGTSKGKGFQGVIKRHNFRGGPGAHGSGFHRHGGSCGMRTTPGRTLPGHKKAGHLGMERVTVQNLKVIKFDTANNALLVEGAIPGVRGGVVYFEPSQKKMKNKK